LPVVLNVLRINNLQIDVNVLKQAFSVINFRLLTLLVDEVSFGMTFTIELRTRESCAPAFVFYSDIRTV